MSKLQKFALGYLLALAMLIWGYQIGRYEAFPYALIEDVSEFVSGHSLGRKTTIGEKLASNAGLVPANLLWAYPADTPAMAKEVAIPGIKARRDLPTVFLAENARRGYRAIFGALDFEDSLWGGLLLGPDGKVLHTWQLSTDHLAGNTERDEQKNMSGVHLFADGSVIFNQQESGGGVVKIDACGKVLWNLDGEFHHSITPTDHGTFWIYGGSQEAFDHVLVEVSVESGEVQRKIDMAEVRSKNPHLHVFDLQRHDNVTDISHGNDIDPLPSHLEGDFSAFAPGSVLLSYRTQNLVFILNPDTLSIDWWRIGPWDRQHDPDWESGGRITVFSNNQKSPREFSDIIAIDPMTLEFASIVDGSDFGFFSSINGNQQRTPFNSRIISSSTQGWVFEVDDNNEIIFSFLNLYDKQDKKALHVSNAMRFDEKFFDTEFWNTCKNSP